MRKIFLMLTSLIAVLGCSSNDESSNIVDTPENLIGSWKIMGYYTTFDIDAQPPTDNFHLIDNINEITFNTNNTFSQIVGSVNHHGTYNVSYDNVLTLNYTRNFPTEPNYSEFVEISLLNETTLETKVNSNEFCGTDAVVGYKYNKIN
ncbi:hypothetical protein [Flavobacterium aquatile]|uniref:Lipocalin-like domain-containing protein n=1 Tax=Flavobacterium aquatile LMG 4008 = ATCC 11947 TaxID=1453498 RepID=A0A095TXW5_9FLAO|nr:hypothetical protein [Flavobacterium aquatile]KGD67193.1 hypothetical protein LG45_13285 [Flavobacterium aquatile LMG 4008 = ATCC 11947]OXA66653.1 hypothetical protein B0A61_10620 [Flavobacterium aquatile LMG 4008 = ATCC 11947]GEC78488.1 hypothetical protein FAQ01_13580 [Flavobacterium aquatile]